MIEEFSPDLTDKELTDDLRERITTDTPYPDEIPFMALPREPYIIAEEPIEPYNNYRSFDNIIPVGTYVNGCRANYTMFDECKKWAEIYGVENIHVGIIANLQENNEQQL